MVDTEIIFGYNFGTPLTLLMRTHISTMELFSKKNLKKTHNMSYLNNWSVISVDSIYHLILFWI